MNVRRVRAVALLVIAAGLHAPDARAVVTLTPGQLKWLTQLTRANLDAWKEMRGLRRLADASLRVEPDPVMYLHIAGRPEKAPERITSKSSAYDAKRVFALGMSYAVWGGKAYADRARRFLLRWAYTYESRGKPVDDSHLEPMILGYELVRPAFPAADRGRVDRWLRQIAQQELRADTAPKPNSTRSHLLKNVGLIGFLLGDDQLKTFAVEGYRKHIARNIHPSGATYDLVEHDALHYQCYDLEALLKLARYAQLNGIDLYHYSAPNGASLPKAVAYLLPFIERRKSHPEWRMTASALDIIRSTAGEKAFKAGKPFDPEEAAQTLMLDSFFDPSVEPLLQRIQTKGKGRKSFRTAESLLFAGEKASASSR